MQQKGGGITKKTHREDAGVCNMNSAIFKKEQSSSKPHEKVHRLNRLVRLRRRRSLFLFKERNSCYSFFFQEQFSQWENKTEEHP